MASITYIKFYLTVQGDGKEWQDYVNLSIMGPNREYYLKHRNICEGATDDQTYYWPSGDHHEWMLTLDKPLPFDLTGSCILQVESGAVPGGDFGFWKARVWLDGFGDNGRTYELIKKVTESFVLFDDDIQAPSPVIFHLTAINASPVKNGPSR